MLKTNHLLLILLSLISGLAGGALAILFLGGASVTAQPAPADVPKTISAQEFRLVDTEGRVRAMLAFAAEGQPFLHLRDESDTHRVWIGISNETGVAIRDVDGKTRLVLSVDEQGEPSLVARNRQHRTKSFQP